MNESNHVELWNRCLDFIKDNVSESAYKTWFIPIVPLKYENKALTIQVPSQFFYEILEEKYVELLRSALYKEIGKGTQLMYRVSIDKTNNISIDQEPSHRTILPNRNDRTTDMRETPSVLQAPAPQDLDPHLNLNYNFDNFIEGESNKLSRTAGETVAMNPAKTTFNPLFIYGPSGVGKTHLVNAIGAKIKELYPEMKVLYISAHLFQVQYTNSVRNNKVNDFIRFYQAIDVLILDDIQEFASLTKTQNTFFHIFNHLHLNGKQLIMTSDRPPVLLQGMEERLLTRFKWGLVAELEKPNLELRKDILREKIHRDGLVFPEEVINYIAENVGDSVRDLEGVVVSIMARSVILNKEIDLDLARYIVQKAVRHEAVPLTVENILEKVCKHFDVEPASIQTKSRKREVVQVRQIAMYLSKKYTDSSTSKIGMVVGKKDHATVLHACKMVKNLLEVDKGFRTELEEIESLLKN